MQSRADTLNTWPVGHMHCMWSSQWSCSKYISLCQVVCVCVWFKELKMFLITGQEDSKSFAITPLQTLHLLHDCKIWCFVGGNDNYCNNSSCQSIVPSCVTTHTAPVQVCPHYSGSHISQQHSIVSQVWAEAAWSNAALHSGVHHTDGTLKRHSPRCTAILIFQDTKQAVQTQSPTTIV
jgi:hypothetical protein